MSAPIIAYRTKSLFVDSKEHLIAKLQVDYATMKSRFHLDEVLTVQIDETTNGVIGLVTIGGSNEAMHNITTRGGVGRIGNMRMLNDGGLNTKGKITEFNIDTEVPNRTAKTNDIKFLTAWYIDSIASEYGIRYRQGASPTWLYIYGDEDLLKSTETTKEFYFPTLIPNQSMEVQAFITNSEGTTYSESLTTLVLNQFVLMSYDDDGVHFGLCSLTKDIEVYYDDDTIEIGTFFYLNSTLSSAAPAGDLS